MMNGAEKPRGGHRIGAEGVTLPWPPKECNPNSRCHWAKKAKTVKAYRQECMVMARNAGLSATWDGDIHLWITFYPPDRRHRDDDNCYSAVKALRDGLADALGVNDRRFRGHPYLSDKVVPGGAVEVKITAGPGIGVDNHPA